MNKTETLQQIMSKSKILDLARKLKALADQGVGGEKVNAEEALVRLMQKHKISLEDLDGEERQEERFRYPSAGGVGYKLARQIIASVLGTPFKSRENKRDRLLLVYVTRAEFLEIEAKLSFYFPVYLKEFKTFYSAFIHVNELGAESKNKQEDRELSPEEIEELARIKSMMLGMEPAPFLKRLE